MEQILKPFRELTTSELFDIARARIRVFVVEQHCPYEELDDADPRAYHLWLRDEAGLAAYMRLLPPGVLHPTASFGRVLTLRRGQGLGLELVQAGLRAAQELWGARRVVIEAQTYAVGFYEKSGFVKTDREFLEDGIPHTEMFWDAE